jgi:putative oxidoreductase
MKYLPLTGRILYSIIFLTTLLGHFKPETIAYAASKGVPFPNILVPFSAILAAAGALSLVAGYKTRTGAWLIVLFLVPVTFFMHAFWKETDPMQVQVQTSAFLKNISLLGAALMIAYFGPGPVSVDTKPSTLQSQK